MFVEEFRREFPRPPYGRSYIHREVQHNIAVLGRRLHEAGIASLTVHLDGYNDEGSIKAIDVAPETEGAMEIEVAGLLDLLSTRPPKPEGTKHPPMPLEQAVDMVCFYMLEHSDFAGWQTGEGSNVRVQFDPVQGAEAWWIDNYYDSAFCYAAFEAQLNPVLDGAGEELPSP